MNIFVIPVVDKYILYAPLKQLSALVNEPAVREIRACLQTGCEGTASVAAILEALRSSDGELQGRNAGELDPVFLGIIPTRGCNIGCRYCDFAASKNHSPVMDLTMVRQAIDAFINLQKTNGQHAAEFHFFGGEPFVADTVVHFALEYASWRASEAGLTTFFEVTTNGVLNALQCQWVSEHFDTVVLSLDGPKDIQDRQRPGINGKSTFSGIVRNAKLLSEGSCDLVLRACITNESVDRMLEIASWFGKEFQPSSVCFETLSPSALSKKSCLEPPDPWKFARNFNAAKQILQEANIETVFSTAELNSCRTSFCPVGKDALILSPDGGIDACYLLPEAWQTHGLDMHLGALKDGRLEISTEALNRIREMNVEHSRLCTDCFCRFHCAGGCHVNHETSGEPGNYDPECIQTRLITILQLLDRLDQPGLRDEWLADQACMQTSVWQANDRLYGGAV